MWKKQLQLTMEIYQILVLTCLLCLGEARLECYTCTGASLEVCKTVSLTCRPEQNRCLSLLMEGNGKQYIKRCARANECNSYNLENMCTSKKDITGAGSCRHSCCEVDNCNHGSYRFASWLTVIIASLVALKIIV